MKRMFLFLLALLLTVQTAGAFSDAGTSGDALPGIRDKQGTEVILPPDAPKLTLDIPVPAVTQRKIPDNEALRFTAKIKAGWNLGNTLDSHGDYRTGLAWETAWGNPRTTEEMVAAVRAAGFNAIRIPVSWHNHVNSNLEIDSAWMNRVREIVGYAEKNGMVTILNIHHDDDKEYVYPDSEHYESSSKYVKAIWSQVAETFKDAGENLIFEGMNEPRLIGHPNEWNLSQSPEDYKDAVLTLNKLNQDFVDTVRASGGNNASRYLMVCGIGADPYNALAADFALPKDPAENRLIVSVHAYVPWNLVMADINDQWSWETFDMTDKGNTELIDRFLDAVYEGFIQKGIPVIVGEYGAINKNDNLRARAEWAAYYNASAKARGIPTFYWDDGGNYKQLDRNTLTWVYPDIIGAIMEYVY